MKEDLYCRCGHPQSFHLRGVGRCRHNCGCVLARLHGRAQGLEVLELVDPGRPPLVAPTYRVRCPDCTKTYDTKAWPLQIVRRRRCRACADRRKASRARRAPCASRPKDLPSADRYAHGSRARYVAGCRCDACREANNAYARLRGKVIRAGGSDPLVLARRARRHLLKLSKAGIGRDTVADVSGVARSSIGEIRTGRKLRIRRTTERRILEVGIDIVSDASLVPAASTWKLIEKLLAYGYTKGEIALRLGRKTPALQLRREFVTARTRACVKRVYKELTS